MKNEAVTAVISDLEQTFKEEYGDIFNNNDTMMAYWAETEARIMDLIEIYSVKIQSQKNTKFMITESRVIDREHLNLDALDKAYGITADEGLSIKVLAQEVITTFDINDPIKLVITLELEKNTDNLISNHYRVISVYDELKLIEGVYMKEFYENETYESYDRYTHVYNYEKSGYTEDEVRDIVDKIRSVMIGFLVLNDNINENSVWFSEDDVEMHLYYAKSIINESAFEVEINAEGLKVVKNDRPYRTLCKTNFNDIIHSLFTERDSRYTDSTQSDKVNVTKNWVTYESDISEGQVKKVINVIETICAMLLRKDIGCGYDIGFKYEIEDNRITLISKDRDSAISLITINDLILKLLKAKFTVSVGIEDEEIYSRYSLENNFNLSMIRDNSYIEFTLEKYKYDKNPMLDRYATRGDLYKVEYMESLLNKF